MGNSNGLCLFKKINVKIVTVLPDYNLNKRVINEYERTFVYNNETLLSELLNFYVGLLLAVLNVDVITLEKSRI